MLCIPRAAPSPSPSRGCRQGRAARGLRGLPPAPRCLCLCALAPMVGGPGRAVHAERPRGHRLSLRGSRMFLGVLARRVHASVNAARGACVGAAGRCPQTASRDWLRRTQGELGGTEPGAGCALMVPGEPSRLPAPLPGGGQLPRAWQGGWGRVPVPVPPVVAGRVLPTALLLHPLLPNPEAAQAAGQAQALPLGCVAPS